MQIRIFHLIFVLENQASRERYWIDLYRNSVLNVLDGDGVDKKAYLKEWELQNKKKRDDYREERKDIKKEYDRQRYLRRKGNIYH